MKFALRQNVRRHHGESSRSHLCLGISMRKTRKCGASGSAGAVRPRAAQHVAQMPSKLWVVDMAGSEALAKVRAQFNLTLSQLP